MFTVRGFFLSVKKMVQSNERYGSRALNWLLLWVLLMAAFLLFLKVTSPLLPFIYSLV